MWVRLCDFTRKQYQEDEDLFIKYLSSKRRFAIYNFNDKVINLLVDQGYVNYEIFYVSKFLSLCRMIKYFKIDTYLDSRSRVAAFYNFLKAVQSRNLLNRLDMFQIYMIKIKEYYTQINEILSEVTWMDKISFDNLRFSRIRDEYCITKKVVDKYNDISEFLISVSDEIPTFIKLFQIKSLTQVKKAMDFFQTCPIQIEILDIEDIWPEVNLKTYKFSQTLLESLEKIYISHPSQSSKKSLKLYQTPMKLFLDLIYVLTNSESNRTSVELKQDIGYNCTLYMGKWTFKVYDPARSMLEYYYS